MADNACDIRNDGEIAENITVEEFSKVKGFKIMHLENIKYSFTPHVNILCFTETWFRLDQN